MEAICEAVDRLPLAIELAAARVRALSTAAIHERLSERLGLLTSRTAMSRSGSARSRRRSPGPTTSSMIDERRVLRGLSVFAGGCTLASAEAVAGADFDSLESLLDKSLIRHRIDEAGQDRYWMLETIREFAQRELERGGETHAVGVRHTAFFATLAGRRGRAERVCGVRRPTRSLPRRSRELRRAHRCALVTGDGASALSFVRRLGRVMGAIGAVSRDWYARAVASIALPGGTREDRAWALVRTARVASLTGDFARARSSLDEADALFVELGDGHGSADAIGARGVVELNNRELRPGSPARRTARSAHAVPRCRRSSRCRGENSKPVGGSSWCSPGGFGRALEEDEPAAAELVGRPRGTADAAAASGTLEQAAALDDLAFSLFVLEAYSESIATGQRALRKLLELEATLEAEMGWVADSFPIIGTSLCGRGDAGSGISLVSAARRMYREVAWSNGPSSERFLAVSRRARGRL